ncbi:SDR family NAD(P)-dependent oxidoreductase [Tsuneonella mangrovi]|uniref:SDR family NAD(P)-dependent oxidoreductase n=1 Tax=Tsuneonella mangrovi TaxID=1982042 RepID=UPI00196A2326|nr:SDR family oxidoreductase [Tsuneonella mangrovi]
MMSDPFDLTGKVAIVTGSSRGIGRAIAERLAQRGAKVVISSRNQDTCEEVASAINAECGEGSAIAIAASISSKEALASLVEKTHGAFGPIDILVCNAASNPHYGSLDTIDDGVFQKTLSNNIISNHWLIQLALPDMRAKGDGAIVVISSIGALRGTPILGAYAITKAADIQLVRNYAVENGKHGIRVNGIAPGLVKTEFARALYENPEAEKAAIARTPMGRLGEPDDIAGMAVFLCSPAASWMTGQTVVVDGGSTV